MGIHFTCDHQPFQFKYDALRAGQGQGSLRDVSRQRTTADDYLVLLQPHRCLLPASSYPAGLNGNPLHSPTGLLPSPASVAPGSTSGISAARPAATVAVSGVPDRWGRQAGTMHQPAAAASGMLDSWAGQPGTVPCPAANVAVSGVPDGWAAQPGMVQRPRLGQLLHGQFQRDGGPGMLPPPPPATHQVCALGSMAASEALACQLVHQADLRESSIVEVNSKHKAH